jgi:hypothetical protein
MLVQGSCDQTPSREVSWVECVSKVVQCSALCSYVQELAYVQARTHDPGMG